MPEWAQYNDDIALCLKAYAAYYRPGGESPIDENGSFREPKDILAQSVSQASSRSMARRWRSTKSW